MALVGAVLLLSGLVAGCGAEPTTEVVPATGVVHLDKEPVEGVMVTFVPDGATPGIGGSGISDSSGRFTLQAGPDQEGIPPGTYRVVFEKHEMSDGSPLPPDVSPMDAGAVNVLPARYSSLEQTTFQATVPAASEADMTFDLSSTGR